MRSASDSSSSWMMSCDFDRGVHSPCEVRGHFSRSAFPCLRLSPFDEMTVDSIVILHERLVPTGTTVLALIAHIFVPSEQDLDDPHHQLFERKHCKAEGQKRHRRGCGEPTYILQTEWDRSHVLHCGVTVPQVGQRLNISAAQ